MHASASFLKKRSKKLSSIAAGTEFERRIQCHPKRIRVFWFFFAKKNTLRCFVSNGLIYLGSYLFFKKEPLPNSGRNQISRRFRHRRRRRQFAAAPLQEAPGQLGGHIRQPS